MCLASSQGHLGTLLLNNLQLLPVGADGLGAFQVMHYAALTPAVLPVLWFNWQSLTGGRHAPGAAGSCG